MEKREYYRVQSFGRVGLQVVPPEQEELARFEQPVEGSDALASRDRFELLVDVEHLGDEGLGAR